ncbi:MAG: PAS/PAC sensor protein [Gallionellaceae bacterium]|nr:MAG: PAS/PAC sensor protein [Gallionellaceae bacterium]
MHEDSLIPRQEFKKEPHQSVAWLLVVLTGSVFLTEVLVMLLLTALPSLPRLTSVLLDATLLSALLFPVFYFLVFRPLLRNITDLKQAKDQLRVAAVAFEIKDPILITDDQANIVRANKMFSHITGYRLEELVGQNPRILNSGRQSKAFYEKMWQQLLRTGFWSGEIRNKNKEGHVNPCRVTITAVKNEKQETTHYVAIYNRM